MKLPLGPRKVITDEIRNLRGESPPAGDGPTKTPFIRSAENSYWDISMAELKLEKQIGEGAFGVVFKGMYRGSQGKMYRV